MSEIIKTEAVVLNKINYGDSSNIISLFTKDFGKLSVIIKGGRSTKSKKSFIVDPLNHLQVVLYKKDTRDLQILSDADIISHFPRVKEDLSKLKFSYGILELIKNLIPEHETNERLFRGIVKIFSLIENSKEKPVILFSRFLMFFLNELGYELQIEVCKSCGKSNLKGMNLAYNYELGIFCEDCKKEYLESFRINAELFSFLYCLKHNKEITYINDKVFEKAVLFMELYLKHHIADFHGIKSFQLFNEV